MNKKNSYDTLSQAMNSLKERGFSEEVEVIDESHIRIGEQKYSDQEVEIVEFHRFEGMSNPADMSVVYALNSKDGKKGLLADAYGADASEKVTKFLENVSME
ncbi:MAG: phosphoribosylpyrophosphate synthetase [Vicingaceae bacterium]